MYILVIYASLLNRLLYFILISLHILNLAKTDHVVFFRCALLALFCPIHGKVSNELASRIHNNCISSIRKIIASAVFLGLKKDLIHNAQINILYELNNMDRLKVEDTIVHSYLLVSNCHYSKCSPSHRRPYSKRDMRGAGGRDGGLSSGLYLSSVLISFEKCFSFGFHSSIIIIMLITNWKRN